MVTRHDPSRTVRLPGVVLPSVAVAGASALVMGPANWLFISCAGWGLAGAAASYFVASVASLLVSVAFVVRLEQSRPVHARCAPHPGFLILRLRACPLMAVVSQQLATRCKSSALCRRLLQDSASTIQG